MSKSTTRTDVKVTEIVVASVTIGGFWLGFGELFSHILDVYTLLLICLVGYVVTMGVAVNITLKEFVEALRREEL